MPAQDKQVFDAMVSTLQSMKKFGFVKYGHQDKPPDQEGATVEIFRVGWSMPRDGMDATEEDRQTNYLIRLTYSNSDVTKRNSLILYYEGIIVNAFHHKRLAGITVPRRTVCEKCKDNQNMNSPAVQVLIAGYFTYRLPPTDGITVS